ncbi:MFS transporter [Tabrizicola sp.]|uniref:MFS transporter n=1 Tax=Tabrizicola sp. TaxID=2005166 RepID=UPI00273302BE|nr:MFS transporter [Tabrizicola sp.]MDP3194087.1 MFS transporter [Tabrizicola sp.]MDZ4069408.1 MFS transporter [Tabrizicola sp.]
MTTRLPAWSLFAALIAMAGLPIYIHAPKFFVDTYGTSLAAMGLTLAALRLIDVVQDPLLGWLAEATRPRRRLTIAIATTLMAASLWGLFAVTPPMPPLLWFALTLAVLFSAFSYLTICFYAEGVSKAQTLGGQGHIRLAGWREGGSLLGVCLAATAPVALAFVSTQPFTAFALIFAAVALIATLAMHREWQGTPADPTPNPLDLFRPVLADPLSRRLLLIALLNASPVAVTSTLFLFFVESRLSLPGWEGPLLLLFFLAAAASTPVWSLLARRHGPRPVLLGAMMLAIASFLWTLTLGTGDLIPFALICIASGVALGADLTLLPAIFAQRLAQTGTSEAAAFGLWSFVSKLSLALAALTILPSLQAAGFQPGQTNPESALATLTLIYAGLPCVLKLTAIALLARTKLTMPLKDPA